MPRSRPAPAPDGVEVLQREPDRVHQVVTAGAGRVVAVRGEALAHRQIGVDDVLSSSAGTFGGGGGAGVPRMFSRIQLPRMTGEVRLA